MLIFKFRLIYITFFLIFLSGCTYYEKPVQKSNRPNIVLVVADDQGWGDLSSNNNPYLNTPTLDKFRKESASIEHFFVSPVCAPTRASLLSGKWAISTGAWGVTNRNEVMREETLTIPEVLKKVGYISGIFGKWHNGAQYPENPKGQGFNEFLGFTSGHLNNYFNTSLKNIDGKFIKTEGYITDVLTNAAIDFIKDHKDSPFFCYIPYNAPHSPFQVPDKYFDIYKEKGLDDKEACIYGMCENMDDNFEKILNILKEKGLDTNTIVIFMSDNGPNTKRYNGKMKGIKASNNEGGTRVPFFIRWPDKVEANKRIHQTIGAHVDIFPTLLNLCGIKTDQSYSFDGIDLSPLLLNKKSPKFPDRYIYSHWSGLSWDQIPGSVRNNRYRLVLERNDTTLYDMKSDPHQKRDIYDSLPKVSNKMMSAYYEWINLMDIQRKGKKEISVGHYESQTTLVEAHDFEINEGLSYYGKNGWANDWIANWDNEQDTLKLNIDIHKTGNYTFQLLYNCTSDQIGSELSMSIQEEQIKKILNIPFVGKVIESPDRIKRKEVYEKTWGVLELGEVQLKKGPGTLKLYSTNISKNSVAEFKGLRIKYN